MLRRTAFTVLLATIMASCSPSAAPAERAAAAGARTSLFATAPTIEWRLPDRLREISGLAFAPDGRLFAHDDERAVLFEVDMGRGQIRRSFSAGDPTEHGDFEDIAITPEGDFWLMTSRGKLLRFREGSEGAHVDFERFDTGLSNVCELEGMTYLASAHSLILACKDHQAEAMRHTLTLYAWPVAGNAPAAVWRSMPEAAVTAAAGIREFHPTAVNIDATSGRILLLSSRDAALAEFTGDGQLVAARRLSREHVQAEGLAIAPDGSLLISDEGAGGSALLAVYGRLQ